MDSLNEQLEDKELKEILKTGTDLRQYSKQVEKEFNEVENQSINDYIKESQNIASLHNQIGDCDTILERMESMLMNFQVSIFVRHPKNKKQNIPHRLQNSICRVFSVILAPK